MGQYGMLRCANNFKVGFGSGICKSCNEIDTEDHRINHCPEWEMINLRNKDEKVSFNDIYSDDDDKCLLVVRTILSMWDLDNGRNEMRS